MRLIRAPGLEGALCCALVAALVFAGATLSPRTLFAQSAADKGTARTLATDGIKLFRAGKYAESFDRMQRAQALYDAPVHVLYIARNQVKLDKLVEAAESYRRLVRTPLDANAPAAFKEAIESGAKELEEIEPQVPALRVEVEPANVDKLELRIDGEAVPVAVLGIDRPANPGSHTVQAWAPGYAASEARIELRAGEKKPLKLVLVPGSGPPPPGFAAPAGAAPAAPGTAPAMVGGPPPPGAEGGVTDPASAEPASQVGFMVGLRLGGAIPGGAAAVTASGDVQMTDLFQPGGGGEIHGGVRFFKYFTGVVFFERHVLKPGEVFDATTATRDLEANSTASAQSYGIGAMIGTPRNQLGGFGEIDLVFDNRFEVQQDFNSNDLPSGQCEATRAISGPGFRIGGGMNIPVADFLHLTPFVMATLSVFTKIEIDTDCPADLRTLTRLPFEGDIPEDNRKGHSLLFFGVGGDFVLGRDKPGP